MYKIIKFGLNKNRTSNQILLLLTIILTLFIIITWEPKPVSEIWNTEPLKVWWGNSLDPWIGILTFFVTIMVWFSKTRTDWEASLEKRLTVKFIHEGQEIMRCEEAYLADEADIRQWSQQIGQQMITPPKEKPRYLKFEPYMQQDGPIICEEESTGKSYCHYICHIHLIEMPEIVGIDANYVAKEYDHMQQTEEDGVLIWRIIRSDNRQSPNKEND